MRSCSGAAASQAARPTAPRTAAHAQMTHHPSAAAGASSTPSSAGSAAAPAAESACATSVFAGFVHRAHRRRVRPFDEEGAAQL
jgi:hypothetical protein